MRKADFIRRQPGIWDFNMLVESVNSIVDRLEAKIDVVPFQIDREVKDFSFFNNEEVPLPYQAHYTISNQEDASKVFGKYVLSYNEMKDINKALEKGNIVSLTILVKELVTEKEEKQETIFDTVETEIVWAQCVEGWEPEVIVKEKPKKKATKKSTAKKKTKWK